MATGAETGTTEPRFADETALVTAFKAFETLMLTDDPRPGDLYRAQNDLRREIARVAYQRQARMQEVLHGVARELADEADRAEGSA